MTRSDLTPMLRHYLEVKAAHPDCILIYRMGDFFELFFEDAIEAAPVLEVTLTARHKGSANETPMCGVPHHAVEAYIGKLIDAGYRVAVCDQVEDPAQAKGLVRREVTRIVTPGTLSDPLLLDGDERSLLVVVEWAQTQGAGAFLEVATGSFVVVRWQSPEEALEDLRLHEPREVLLSEDTSTARIAAWGKRRGVCVTELGEVRRLAPREAQRLLQDHFGVGTLRGFGLEEVEPAVRAAAHALAYALETQGSKLPHIQELRLRTASRGLMLDSTTLANLEVFRNARDGSRRASLLSVVDSTRTAAGARRLQAWLREPLTDPEAIGRRLDAVEELLLASGVRARLRDLLGGAGDLQRLLARAALGSLSPREAAVLRDTLRLVPEIVDALDGCVARLLVGIRDVAPLEPLRERLDEMLEEEPAATLKNGGVIAAGVDEELDRCRSLARDSKRTSWRCEARERERPGSVAQDPLQQGLRLLPRGHQGQLDAVPERLHPQADPGQRRALRHARRSRSSRSRSSRPRSGS